MPRDRGIRGLLNCDNVLNTLPAPEKVFTAKTRREVGLLHHERRENQILTLNLALHN